MNQGLVVSKWYWAPRYSLFERVHENLKHEVREEICIENHSKQVGRDQMFGGVGSEGITSGGKECEPGARVSEMALSCQLCGRRAHQRNKCLCQHICVGESCPSSSHPDAKQFSSSPCVSDALQAADLALEVRESESE